MIFMSGVGNVHAGAAGGDGVLRVKCSDDARQQQVGELRDLRTASGGRPHLGNL